MADGKKPTILLCHGIWADGSCFNKMIPSLLADGFPVVAAQYGLDSYAADVGMIRRILRRIEGPVILVGHSYGGATITAAGIDDKVVGLVYVAAVAPDAGETVQQQLEAYPSAIFEHIEIAEDRVWLLPEAPDYFAGDLSEEEKKIVWTTHYPPAANLFQQQNLTEAEVAWRHKPCWYVLATADQTVNPDLQRWVSKRMNATVTEVESSHVPILSHPDIVVSVIRAAASAL